MIINNFNEIIAVKLGIIAVVRKENSKTYIKCV